MLLMDHSTGHMRKRNDGLDAKQLGKCWGGKGGHSMRKTIVTEVWDYPHTHQVGEEQCLQFQENNDCPFI